MDQMNGTQGQKVREYRGDRLDNVPFTEYWDIFLLKHQHPMNVALHVVGILIFYGILFAAVWFQNSWILLGLPLTQLTGLMGHFWFERSEIQLRDAVFSWRASFCLGRMLWRILLGKYKEDVRQRVELSGGASLLRVEMENLEGGKENH
ncbi:DUF962 domain-containing protein [Laspinema olomoucense]|uniref:DUF962 domain-containing protein n=1 Tax=Laspinema olomoucense D3b TaxID=2953688 RepID=A0ABT2N248_9CYAN|nr:MULTISPECIES: DUF962 domain-containing protein [unclassified Laspinema]MCT7972052.1 DUF962 domain-containing protein [Laspinema sp. D3d]MCT7976531.1 DUF962 domain-containing protein [Laspinema sp. D3b]MCT7990329.1 DUF962 domain-containing protein [Laspinema sp. D3a]MCT7994961.1 DUF962 domain-containing protein [Laspinema sp. D3c]